MELPKSKEICDYQVADRPIEAGQSAPINDCLTITGQHTIPIVLATRRLAIRTGGLPARKVSRMGSH